MTTEVTETCDRCFRTFPHESLARDTVDAAMLFCPPCKEAASRPCAYCQFDMKPPKTSPAIAGWLFGEGPNQQWNLACETCVKEKKLHKRIDTERVSARVALQMLSKQLKEEGLEEEGLYIYDHAEERKALGKSLLNWRWIPCYVVTGGSEGHYVHIDVLRHIGIRDVQETHLLASVKTFMGRRRAYEVALRCAELLGA